jgi:predicted dehydrogenase
VTVEPQRPVTIALIGSGVPAERWRRALRGVDAVDVTATPATPDDALLDACSNPAVEAVAVAAPVPDLPGAVRRALLAGRHVFVAMPAALSSKQLAALGDTARRRDCVLLFDWPGLGDDRFAFARKMMAGPNALWRPRYVRSLRTGSCERQALDELAMADIAVVSSLVDEGGAAVSAVAPRIDDEEAGGQAAMLTLAFDTGAVARIDVSLLEPMLRHEVIVACDGRTVTIDPLDARAPLQVMAAGRHAMPRAGQWSETIIEHPSDGGRERTAVAAASFVTGVRSRDREAGNAREMAAASRVWEAARASMARGGEMVRVAGDDAGRPTLRAIEGGGQTTDAPAPPALTVVRGRR